MSEVKDEKTFNTMRTAVLTAYPKIFGDIDLASEIFFSAIKLAVDYGFSFRPSLFVADLAVEIEARHKAVNAALESVLTDKTLVIELGAGLSPRRAQFAHTDYIEVDHSPIVDMKSRVYRELGHTEFAKDLYAVDLTDVKTFRDFIEHTSKSRVFDRVIVLSEGLFWYLDKSRIHDICSVLNTVLDGADWMWLTADSPVDDKNYAEYRKVIVDSADRGEQKPFRSYAEMCAFFEECGLTSTRHRLADCVSPERIYSGKLFAAPDREIEERMNKYADIAILKVVR